MDVRGRLELGAIFLLQATSEETKALVCHMCDGEFEADFEKVCDA